MMNSAITSESQPAMSPCGALMRRRPRGCEPCACRSLSVFSAIVTSSVLRSSSTSPASVRLRERVERFSRRTPLRDSSSAT
ncbi:hypothetical protein D9M69_556850 [compost metagenome]